MSYISGLIEAELIIKKERKEHEQKHKYQEVIRRNETNQKYCCYGKQKSIPKS